MAEQNVVIKIQADVSKATSDVKALQQVIAKLSTSGTQAAAGTQKVSNAAKKTATASQLLDKEIKKVVAGQGDLTKVAELATQALAEQEAVAKRLAKVSEAVEGAVGKKGSAVLGANKQIGGLADATGSASFALLSLGQAFQDSAQFGMGFAQGFRAINNNIQQTFTALALGSVQAGGFKNLLIEMGGSLWGPGGLILGFSAVSAAVEFFTTRAQRASKEARDLNDAWVELANVIPTENIGEFNISQVELEKRLASARTELEKLSKQQELQKMAAGFGQMALTGNDASAATAALQSDIDRLTETLDKVNESGENYVTWVTSIAGLQALSAQTTQDFEKKIADLEARLAMSGEFVEFEQRISDLQDAIASGLGLDEKDPAKVIATLNTKYEEFLKTLSEMGSSASVSREEFAKMLGEDALGKFLADEQWKVTVKNLDAIKKESNEIAKAWEKILGIDGRLTIADLADELEVPDRLFTPESFNGAIDQYEQYVAAANRVVDQNQAIKESMAQVATDLAVSFATMGGGFDAFMRTMGRFLSKYGAEMIKHGMLTSMLGVSIEAVKDALAKFQGKKAIVAGLALVAIGSRLRSNARNASSRLQGGGSASSSGASRPNFTMPNPLTSPASFTSQGMFPATSNAPSFSGRFVASGRDLVAVVGTEINAQQEIGIRNPLNITG